MPGVMAHAAAGRRGWRGRLWRAVGRAAAAGALAGEVEVAVLTALPRSIGPLVSRDPWGALGLMLGASGLYALGGITLLPLLVLMRRGLRGRAGLASPQAGFCLELWVVWTVLHTAAWFYEGHAFFPVRPESLGSLAVYVAGAGILAMCGAAMTARILERAVRMLPAMLHGARGILLLLVVVPGVTILLLAPGEKPAGGRGERDEPGLAALPEEPRAPLRRTRGGPPNILLLSIDALRRDRCTPYNPEQGRTPSIDRLAREGVLFEDIVATSSWTRPSIWSIHTSADPEEHGVVTEDAPPPPSPPFLLPRTLGEAGYVTAAFSPNPNACEAALGFDRTVQRGYLARRPVRLTPLSVWRLHVGGVVASFLQFRWGILFPRELDSTEVGGTQINARFLRWVARQRFHQPFFAHVHYMDPHAPYLARPLRTIQFDPRTPESRPKILRRYEEEVELADHAVGQVMDALRRLGLADRTAVLVTADHGEEFLEHGGWEHQTSLYEEVLRVPLVIRAPGRLPSGTRVGGRGSLVDLAPTILDLAGLPVPRAARGRSLLPAARTGAPLEERRILAHLRRPDGTWRAMWEGKWKLLVRWGEGEGSWLYDLEEDPAERVDCSARDPERKAAMMHRLGDALLHLEVKALLEEVALTAP